MLYIIYFIICVPLILNASNYNIVQLPKLPKLQKVSTPINDSDSATSSSPGPTSQPLSPQSNTSKTVKNSTQILRPTPPKSKKLPQQPITKSFALENVQKVSISQAKKLIKIYELKERDLKKLIKFSPQKRKNFYLKELKDIVDQYNISWPIPDSVQDLLVSVIEKFVFDLLTLTYPTNSFLEKITSHTKNKKLSWNDVEYILKNNMRFNTDKYELTQQEKNNFVDKLNTYLKIVTDEEQALQQQAFDDLNTMMDTEAKLLYS